MSDFWEFIQGVFWHWQSWAGGSGVGGAIVVFFAIYQQLSGRPVSKRMYVAVFIFGFLTCAFFLAWKDQYHARLEAEQKLNVLYVPNFKLSYEWVVGMSTPETQGSAYLIAILHIVNSGAPSTINLPKLFLVHPDGSTTATQWIPKPGKTITLNQPDGTTLWVQPEDFLMSKFGEKPIPTNGGAEGFFWVKASGVSAEKNWQGVKQRSPLRMQ